jgi:hypothetical protein
MQRRRFLSASLGASALALAGAGDGMAGTSSVAVGGSAEYYDLRRYQLSSGPQTKLTQDYFANALIPALNRLGIAPVGTFSLDFGPDTPAYYVLMPSAKLDVLALADQLLAKDPEFVKAAAPFWSAAATAPPFVQIDSSLMRAFEGHPKVTRPDFAASKDRIFQLRTYRSPTNGDHVRKVEMFHSGEFEIFARSGCAAVFYGDTLVGPKLPNLTYMLSFPDMPALTAGWDKFRQDPEWKKLSSDPRFAYEAIVTNISSLLLRPLPGSQI